MRQIILLMLLLISAIFISCKKASTSNNKCFAGTSTVRLISNKHATIKALGGQFYIVEEGTIDTRLNPCNLATEFNVDGLNVVISGEVKSTIINGPEPCCTENFVITNISQ